MTNEFKLGFNVHVGKFGYCFTYNTEYRDENGILTRASKPLSEKFIAEAVKEKLERERNEISKV